MWDLTPISVFINHTLYVDYSSSQYGTWVLHLSFDFLKETRLFGQEGSYGLVKHSLWQLENIKTCPFNKRIEEMAKN